MLKPEIVAAKRAWAELEVRFGWYGRHGRGDLEEQCEDEGAQCEDEGAEVGL